MTTYTVVRYSANSWHGDGTRVIERDCGHRHRTIAAAARCLDNLIDYNPRTRMWSAAWNRATLMHGDQTALTDSEREELSLIRAEA